MEEDYTFLNMYSGTSSKLLFINSAQKGDNGCNTNSGELNRQNVKGRHPDVSEKMKPSSELLYKKLEESFTFLDMYSGMAQPRP